VGFVVEDETLNISICSYGGGIDTVKWLPQRFKLGCVNQIASNEQVPVNIFVIVINGGIGGKIRWRLDPMVLKIMVLKVYSAST
jgi:hypothetical protein